MDQPTAGAARWAVLGTLLDMPVPCAGLGAAWAGLPEDGDAWIAEMM